MATERYAHFVRDCWEDQALEVQDLMYREPYIVGPGRWGEAFEGLIDVVGDSVDSVLVWCGDHVEDLCLRTRNAYRSTIVKCHTT
jgi:hypothetical protein